MVRCDECGQPNDTDARFCKHCGAALPEDTASTMDDRPEAAEPAEAAADVPEIPAIAQFATGDDNVAEATGARDNEQERQDAMARLAVATQARREALRLEKLRAAEIEPEPETFAQGDYSKRDYSRQDYGRDYASDDEREPRPPVLPPIQAAIREEAVLQAPMASSSPSDAKEMDGDVKKLGASCGWGCAILFVVWIIAMAVMVFVNRAG